MRIDDRLLSLSKKMESDLQYHILVPFFVSLSAGFWATYITTSDKTDFTLFLAIASIYTILFFPLGVFIGKKINHYRKKLFTDDTDIEIFINEEKLIEYINVVATSYYYINDIQTNNNKVLKTIYIEEAIILLELFLEELFIAKCKNNIDPLVEKRLLALFDSSKNCYELLVNEKIPIEKIKRIQTDIQQLNEKYKIA
jgi:hypothetical protein